jgi:hypothetical protein
MLDDAAISGEIDPIVGLTGFAEAGDIGSSTVTCTPQDHWQAEI